MHHEGPSLSAMWGLDLMQRLNQGVVDVNILFQKAERLRDRLHDAQSSNERFKGIVTGLEKGCAAQKLRVDILEQERTNAVTNAAESRTQVVALEERCQRLEDEARALQEERRLTLQQQATANHDLEAKIARLPELEEQVKAYQEKSRAASMANAELHDALEAQKRMIDSQESDLTGLRKLLSSQYAAHERSVQEMEARLESAEGQAEDLRQRMVSERVVSQGDKAHYASSLATFHDGAELERCLYKPAAEAAGTGVIADVSISVQTRLTRELKSAEVWCASLKQEVTRLRKEAVIWRERLHAQGASIRTITAAKNRSNDELAHLRRMFDLERRRQEGVHGDRHQTEVTPAAVAPSPKTRQAYIGTSQAEGLFGGLTDSQHSDLLRDATFDIYSHIRDAEVRVQGRTLLQGFTILADEGAVGSHDAELAHLEEGPIDESLVETLRDVAWVLSSIRSETDQADPDESEEAPSQARLPEVASSSDLEDGEVRSSPELSATLSGTSEVAESPSGSYSSTVRKAVWRGWTSPRHDEMSYEALLEVRRQEKLVDVDRYVPDVGAASAAPPLSTQAQAQSLSTESSRPPATKATSKDTSSVARTVVTKDSGVIRQPEDSLPTPTSPMDYGDALKPTEANGFAIRGFAAHRSRASLEGIDLKFPRELLPDKRSATEHRDRAAGGHFEFRQPLQQEERSVDPRSRPKRARYVNHYDPRLRAPKRTKSARQGSFEYEHSNGSCDSHRPGQ